MKHTFYHRFLTNHGNRVVHSNIYTICKNTIKYIWLWSFEIYPWKPCKLTCDVILIYKK